jgi:hypothetical protein
MAMTHSMDAYRRVAVLGLQHEVVRGVLAAVVLVLLLAGGASFLAAIILAAVAYGGLRLIASSLIKPDTKAVARRAPRSAREAYAMCLELRPVIELLAGSVADPMAASRLDQITGRIRQSLEVIVEDGAYDASPLLLDLMRTTADLLYPFAKVARRGLDDTELRTGFVRDLGTLVAAFDLLWERINRDAIVNLTTASEMIDLGLDGVTRSRHEGGAS